MQTDLSGRTPKIVYRAFRKQILPSVSSNMSIIGIALIDSLIAARYIGPDALAAISLVSPILMLSEALHCLFVSGTTPLLIQYKSRGEGKKAARAFASILAVTFVAYMVIWSLAAFFAKDIISLFTTDEKLLHNALLYFLPVAVSQPISEIGLCFERGFKSEGNHAYFGVRGIIANVLNVVFSIVVVQIYHGGILGIAISSVTASFLGYLWSFAHIFRKKCTIRPDVSVVCQPQEMLQYVREEMKIGSVYAIDSAFCSVSVCLFTKALIICGGSVALAAYGVAKTILGLIETFDSIVQFAMSNLCNLFYSNEDHRGVEMSFVAALKIEAVADLVFWAVCCLSYRNLALLYNLTEEAAIYDLKIFFLLFSVVCFSDYFTNLFGEIFLSSRREKISTIFVVVLNIAGILSSLIGMVWGALIGFLSVHAALVLLVAVVEFYLIDSSKLVFRSQSKTEIRSYSYFVDEENISRIIGDIRTLEKDDAILNKVSLLVEECNRLILYHNDQRAVFADLRLNWTEDQCVVTILDDGEVFNSAVHLRDDRLPMDISASKKILTGIADKVTYNRVVDLNMISIALKIA